MQERLKTIIYFKKLKKTVYQTKKSKGEETKKEMSTEMSKLENKSWLFKRQIKLINLW